MAPTHTTLADYYCHPGPVAFCMEDIAANAAKKTLGKFRGMQTGPNAMLADPALGIQHQRQHLETPAQPANKTQTKSRLETPRRLMTVGSTHRANYS